MAGSRGRSCGACGSRLIGWGSYRRWLRQGPERSLVRVPRRHCRRCGRTGGALPEGILHRRPDGIDTVGRIIAAGIQGTTVREIAAATGVPARTVRAVRRRYRGHAPELAHRLLALSVALGGHLSLAVDIPIEPERRAAFALGAAWTAARRHGAPGATPWRWLAAITGGRVLGTNTRVPGADRRAPVVLSRAAPSGHDAGNRMAWAGRRHRSGRAPPSTSGRALSSGAARHHRPSPNHRHAILPDHHQIARPATTAASPSCTARQFPVTAFDTAEAIGGL